MLKLITKTQAAWASRDRGATAVEYGLMVALIAAAIVVLVGAFGTELADLFGDTCNTIDTDGSSGVAGC
ncbi:Flp family type IVb pilin [Catellatospora sp. NPDC049609]|uniref:Flp family type IVb pilin n=1 Tax=Catellatospora sp. NPDC049609 TaxID=3155505 RepID=UPI003439192C